MEGDKKLWDDRDKHWKDIVEDSINGKEEVHTLRWELYTKKKEELLNRGFLGGGSTSEKWEGCLDLCVG